MKNDSATALPPKLPFLLITWLIAGVFASSDGAQNKHIGHLAQNERLFQQGLGNYLAPFFVKDGLYLLVCEGAFVPSMDDKYALIPKDFFLLKKRPG